MHSVKKYRVLITGASGFVGSNAARFLGECGWTVGVIYLPLPDGSTGCAVSEADSFPYSGSYESVRDCIHEFQPDIVMHFASLFLARHEPAHIGPLLDANILFGTQLLEAMAAEGVRFFVNTGTSWQHYHSDGYDPACLYAATKQAFEDILQYYVEACGVKAVTLKLFDTYGPGDRRPKLLNLLRRAFKAGETLKMSPGEQRIDLVHVRDVARAFKRAAELLVNGEIGSRAEIAIRSGKPVTLRELVATIEQLSGSRLHVEFGAMPYRPREVMTPWCGEILPGWVPEITLEQGLREFLSGNDT
jgi:nucleoside-diphosphate-sugar epimerase